MGSPASPRPGPGRPASDAPERIVDAGLAILGRDGYAGLTTAKVAAASGQNKALISYYFGSKEGLVEAIAAKVRETIVSEFLSSLDGVDSVAALIEALTAAIWRVMDRDEAIPRAYFDLASRSVAEDRVRRAMAEVKGRFRGVLIEVLRDLPDGPRRKRELEIAAVYLIAGIEGLALARLGPADPGEVAGARALFEHSAAAAISRA